MSSTSVGRRAENVACDFIKRQNFQILDQNWRTAQCEIDIIAKKHQVVYFIEVKYRKSIDWGGGIEYITPKKLKQMEFSAQYWVSVNNYDGEYCLGAIEVEGSNFKVTKFLTDL